MVLFIGTKNRTTKNRTMRNSDRLQEVVPSDEEERRVSALDTVGTGMRVGHAARSGARVDDIDT